MVPAIPTRPQHRPCAVTREHAGRRGGSRRPCQRAWILDWLEAKGRGRGEPLAFSSDPAVDGRRTATCYDQCASLFLSACTLAPTGPVLVASFSLDLAQEGSAGCRSRR